MASNRRQVLQKKLVYFCFFLLSHHCYMFLLYPPAFLYTVFHSTWCSQEFCCTTHWNQFTSLQNLTQSLLWKFHHWQHVWVFFLCLIISFCEIKYPYLHPHITHSLNLAAIYIFLSLKISLMFVGEAFCTQRTQCYNVSIKDLTCN